MIDHEFRIISPILKDTILKRLSSEKILNEKIPKKILNKKIELQTINYLESCKLITGLVYRGLPINDKKRYFEQEYQIEDTFKFLVNKVKRPITGKRFMQIPNPDYVSFNDFYKLFKDQKKIDGFEIISFWHQKKCSDKSYNKFYDFVQETKLPLALEINFMHKTGKEGLCNAKNFFEILETYKKIKFWLPKFGAGIFLHWDKILDSCETPPLLLTSAYSSMTTGGWLPMFKMPKLRNIPLEFATDHPFNDMVSTKIYKIWKKYKKTK